DRRTPRAPPADPVDDEAEDEASAPAPLWRPWRYAAGVAFGAATSVKWSGGLGMLTAIVVSLMWETVRRQRGDIGRGRAFARAIVQESFSLVLAFVFIPAIVYVTTYLPWLHHFGWDVPRFLDQQLRIAKYHLFVLKTEAIDPATGSLTPTHYGYSRPWTWLWMKRPLPLTWPGHR